MDLTVVLRCCGRTGVAANNTPRISGVDRLDLILRCIKSLVESINHSKYKTKLIVLDDHSDEHSKSRIRQIISEAQSEYEFIELSDRSAEFVHPYNWSAYEQFRYARDANGLVYIVEDDYLHSISAISSMIEAFYFFRSISDLNSIAIYPYDSTHNYMSVSNPARLFYIDQRLWRTTTKSANTMFIHSSDIQCYWPLFEKLATGYGVDETNEDTTINRLWSNGVTQGGPIILFSPIPSVAAHISFDEPIQLTTDMNDWRVRYNQIKV